MIKVHDIAFGRLQSPDLDQAEEFLTDFGMVRAERTNDALYMRGTDPDNYIHVTHKGDPKFVGLAFEAASEEDLDIISKADGASDIESMDDPGGGKRVRLTEPNGYQIEIVWGREDREEIPVDRFGINTAAARDSRLGELTRIQRGPSHVKRLGHAVIMTPDVAGGTKWFRDHLGLVSSDDVYAGEEDNIIATFNRIDGGERFVDHHTFLCIGGENAGLNHMAFEVHDIDDVFMGNAHLKAKEKYDHMWGLGRHVLGSQVYDYWQDPWGRVHEHWTDSDRLNNQNPPNLVAAEDGLDSQWGEPVPERFINHATP
ncbi:MAG: catechol 1,2-dioxygenase [Pseudomonadota bacterium]|nr:catechol 1,2-dioxygenase [Pseudomonadota bacterium]|tara:strand:+ start:162 stop:1103 length:942 start_codon:yes stop_codon:yes gene_type:complete